MIRVEMSTVVCGNNSSRAGGGMKSAFGNHRNELQKLFRKLCQLSIGLNSLEENIRSLLITFTSVVRVSKYTSEPTLETAGVPSF